MLLLYGRSNKLDVGALMLLLLQAARGKEAN